MGVGWRLRTLNSGSVVTLGDFPAPVHVMTLHFLLSGFKWFLLNHLKGFYCPFLPECKPHENEACIPPVRVPDHVLGILQIETSFPVCRGSARVPNHPQEGLGMERRVTCSWSYSLPASVPLEEEIAPGIQPPNTLSSFCHAMPWGQECSNKEGCLN